jgi:hypothetical protein
VKKALAAADALVTSNCTGADRRIVSSSDPGPLAPPTATAMRSIGSMLHCEAAPASSTSTVAAPTTTTSLGGPSATLPSSVRPAGGAISPAPPAVNVTNPSTAASTAPPATAAAGTLGADGSGGPAADSRSALLTATKLPLPQPGGASGTDRFATFLLGALLYLIARKPVGRLARRIAS